MDNPRKVPDVVKVKQVNNPPRPYAKRGIKSKYNEVYKMVDEQPLEQWFGMLFSHTESTRKVRSLSRCVYRHVRMQGLEVKTSIQRNGNGWWVYVLKSERES